MSIKIAVCDDEIYYTNHMVQCIHGYAEKNNEDIGVQCFYDAKSFLESDLKSYHIIFMDVKLDETDGIELAKNLRKQGITTIIIYVSVHLEASTEAYEVKAFRYILKEKMESELPKALNDALQEIRNNEKVYEIRHKGRVECILLKDIVYIESYKRILKIHAGQREYEQYGRLSDLAERLKEDGFYRIHKSYIANVRYILMFENKNVILKDGTILPCSRTEYGNIIEQFILWKGKH